MVWADINERRITVLENANATHPAEFFESIASGTSGTLSIPARYVILLNQWSGGVDAIVSGISGGVPDGTAVLDSSGEVVTTTLNSSGAWAFSSEPASFPVAIVAALRVEDTVLAHPAIPDNTDNEDDRTFSSAYQTHTASLGGNCTLIVADLSTEQSEMSWLLTTTAAVAVTLSGPTFEQRTTQTLDSLESGYTYPVELKTYDNGTTCHIWVGAGVAV